MKNKKQSLKIKVFDFDDEKPKLSVTASFVNFDCQLLARGFFLYRFVFIVLRACYSIAYCSCFVMPAEKPENVTIMRSFRKSWSLKRDKDKSRGMYLPITFTFGTWISS